MALNFIKTGAASVQAAQQVAAEAEQRKATMGKAYRFWLKPGEEGRITFVDGELSPEGFLIPPRWYEHNLFLNGQWGNYFVCPAATFPENKDSCSICESGDRPSLVAGFTIIDHREYKVQNGKNAGKVYKDTRKLLVAGPQSFELLNKLAVKLGGLACQTFDVTRLDEKAARIGSLFVPIEKKPVEVLQSLYKREVTDPKTNAKSMVTNFVRLDFENDIDVVCKTGDELRKMGLGKPAAPVMSPGGMQQPQQQPVDYSQQL